MLIMYEFLEMPNHTINKFGHLSGATGLKIEQKIKANKVFNWFNTAAAMYGC